MSSGSDSLNVAAVLSAAKALIASVHRLLLSGGDVASARLLNDALGILDDEIAALDKAIGAARP